MIKRLIATSMLLLSSEAFSEVVGSVGYYNADSDDYAVDLDVVAATVGYKFGSDTSYFSVTTELRAGVGVEDKRLFGINGKINRLYGFNVRGQWDFDNDAYVFVAPSYTNIELEGSGFGVTVTADDWKYATAAGLGYYFAENRSVELSYERFQAGDVLGLALRVGF